MCHLLDRWRVVSLLVAMMLCGCCHAFVQDWASPEVDFVQPTMTPAGELDIAMNIKNINGLEDGRYEVAIAGVTRHQSGHASVDLVEDLDGVSVGPLIRLGERDLRDPLEYAYVHDFFPPHGFDAESLNDVVVRTAALQSKPPIEKKSEPYFPEVGVIILKDMLNRYRVEVYVMDYDKARWGRAGSVLVGTGCQSAGRFVAAAAVVPLAFLVDLALTPIYLIRNQVNHGCCCGGIPL